MVLPGMTFVYADTEQCSLTDYLAAEIVRKINSKRWNVYDSSALNDYHQQKPEKPRMRIVSIASPADIDRAVEEIQRPFEPEPRDPELDSYMERMMSQGPVYVAAVHNRYMLAPVVDNPQDAQEVLRAVEFHGKIPSFVVPYTRQPAVAIYREPFMKTPQGQELSTYRILPAGEKLEFTGFTPRNGDVKLHTRDGIHVEYDFFLEALDNLCDLTTQNNP